MSRILQSRTDEKGMETMRITLYTSEDSIYQIPTITEYNLPILVLEETDAKTGIMDVKEWCHINNKTKEFLLNHFSESKMPVNVLDLLEENK